MCDSAWACEEAQGRIEHVLGRLGLKLHPDKTRRVDLTQGAQGFDFLGCHLHKRMSGRLWEQKGLKRYYLQRWPSQRAMKRISQRLRELTSRERCHQDLRDVIAAVNPVLRGWGQYFRSGNAAIKFTQVDRYVVRRLSRKQFNERQLHYWKFVFFANTGRGLGPGMLKSLRLKRAGRTLHAGQGERWDRDYFENLGLHRLRGTIRYPGQSSRQRESA